MPLRRGNPLSAGERQACYLQGRPWRPHWKRLGCRKPLPRQREVIDLLYFGGGTQVAAEELCIPLATVRTRARAALLVH